MTPAYFDISSVPAVLRIWDGVLWVTASAIEQGEVPQDSGMWKAGHTADGLHPNPAGHAAAALAIDTGALVA
jgi:lysophospholipase L1-like esterase